MTLRDIPPVSRFYEICLLQLGHFHVAGWILNYWPTWRSSRLASRVGRNDKNWRNYGAKGIHSVQFLGKIRVGNEKHWVKKHGKHSTSKKGESLKLINLLITIFEKENLVWEGHKGFPPHPASSHSLIKYSNTEILLLLENKIQYS